MTPGWVRDMYKIRMDYDLQINWGKSIRKMT